MKHGPFRAAAGPQCVRIEGAYTPKSGGGRGRQRETE